MRSPRCILLLAGLLSAGSVLAQTDDDRFHACGNTPQAMALARLIITDPAQQRSRIKCNPLLANVAEQKVQSMAEHGLVMHNLDGSPNSRLRDAGFPLPSYYGSAMSNQVEAIAGGYRDAEQVWRAFKHSKEHRAHLLGELDFYREQDELGVGFYRNVATPHVEYWTVYLTKSAGETQGTLFEYIPNKGMDILLPDAKPEPIQPQH